MKVERALWWYPPAWREQFGDEFAALLADTIAVGGGGFRLWWNVARSGLVVRAEWSGVIGDRAGPERRSRAGALVAFCAAGVFLFVVAVAARSATGWQRYPFDEQSERYGLHPVTGPGVIRGSVTDAAPWMHGATGTPVIAARVAQVGMWLTAACLAVAAAAVIVVWVRSATGGRPGRRWVRPGVTVGVPLVLYGLARLVHHVQWTWLNESNRWTHTVAGISLARWSRVGADGLVLTAAVVALVGIVQMARRVTFRPRVRRVMTATALALTATMTATVAALAVWAAGLYAQAPDVLRDHAVPQNIRHIGPYFLPPGFGHYAVGLFGTPLWATLIIGGVVLILGLAIAAAGARRATARPAHLAS